MASKKLVLQKRHSILIWIKNYNVTMAGVFALVLYAVMLIAVIVTVVCKKNPQERSTYKKLELFDKDFQGQQNKLLEATSGTCQVINGATCEIVCKKFKLNEISRLPESIKNATAQCTKTNTTQLIIAECQFEYGLSKDIFSSLQNVSIIEITLSSNQLTFINDYAFANLSLNKLTLTNNPISYLQKKALSGLTTLQQFHFDLNNSNDTIQVEAGFFDNVSHTLESMLFQGCLNDSKAVVNITGTGKPLTKLATLDMMFNLFNELQSYSFAKAPKLQSLHLSNGYIESLDANTFSGLNDIRILDISRNSIEFLPEGLFDGIDKGVGQKLIKINDNKFNCNCSMIWFRDFYEENHIQYFLNEEFFCLVNENGNEVTKNYSEVVFCKTTTTTTSVPTTLLPTTLGPTTLAPTTSAPTASAPTRTTAKTRRTTMTEFPSSILPTTTTEVITTTQKSENYPLRCIKSKKASSSSSLRESKDIEVRSSMVKFYFQRIGTSAKYHLLIKGDVSNDYLIWKEASYKINTFNHCIYDIDDYINMDFEYEKTYTLCLLRNGAETVLPDECTSLSVPAEWTNEPWIPNKYRSMVISITITLFIIAMIITGITIFFIIRQNPKLIKGNKRVLVVGRKVDDFLILPDKIDKISKQRPSLVSKSDGYLTPVPTRNGVAYTVTTISKKRLSRQIEAHYDYCIKCNHKYDKLTKKETSCCEVCSIPPPPLPPRLNLNQSPYNVYNEL